MRKFLYTLSAAPALVPTLAWAQTQPTDRDFYGPHMMWGAGGMAGAFFMILMMVLIIGAVVLLVRWLGGPWPGHMGMHSGPPAHKALDILKERFARGEIDKAEFEERRRALGE